MKKTLAIAPQCPPPDTSNNNFPDPLLWDLFKKIEGKNPSLLENPANQKDFSGPPIRKAVKIYNHDAPLPTPLCRVSPFFILPRKDLKNRKFVRDLTIVQNSWGEINYTGPILSIFEEDLILAILAIADPHTLSYSGPIYPILKLLGLTRGKKNYRRIISATKLLMASCIEIKECRSKKKNETTIIFTHLLQGAGWKEKEKIYDVQLHEAFRGYFSQNRITTLDLKIRTSLTSGVAKAIHRFIMSHDATRWEGDTKKLEKAINLNQDQPDKEKKRTLKDAIQQLINKNILHPKSGIGDNSLVLLQRIR